MRHAIKSKDVNTALRSSALRWRLQAAAAAVYAPALVAVTYYLGAEIAFYIGTLSDRIFAPFWPPNIILFCTLLLVPERRWWLFILATFPAHVVAEIGVGMPMPQYLVAFATNCAVAILSAAGVRRWVRGPPWFVSVRQVSAYVLIAVIASPALSALGGAFVQILGGGPFEDYWIYWAHWYSANALASATLGPVFLTWISAGAKPSLLPAERKIEAAILVFGLICACFVAFGASPKAISGGFYPVLLYLPVPFVIWGAVRFGAIGASGTILIVTVVALGRSLQGNTVFSVGSPEHNVLALQAFLTVFSIPVLLLGAAIEELQRARNGMQDLAGVLLRTQDEERRQVSKNLHERIGQDLAAAHLIASRLDPRAPAACEPMIGELAEILQRSMREIRAVSNLLYPPLLDEAGLALALKAYVGGLSKRSGVTVDLTLSPKLGRLPAGIEFVLFRVIQDAVTNVHLYSGSPEAHVALTLDRTSDTHEIVLTIQDIGEGIDDVPASRRIAGPEELAGLGLAGMHERLRQIGGRLDVKSTLGRTIVTAAVPILD